MKGWKLNSIRKKYRYVKIIFHLFSTNIWKQLSPTSRCCFVWLQCVCCSPYIHKETWYQRFMKRKKQEKGTSLHHWLKRGWGGSEERGTVIDTQSSRERERYVVTARANILGLFAVGTFRFFDFDHLIIRILFLWVGLPRSPHPVSLGCVAGLDLPVSDSLTDTLTTTHKPLTSYTSTRIHSSPHNLTN